MLKTAATELVYSSTIPARLAGNSDPKYLQEVIATEKLVLQSLQRLSTDFGKSSDALRAWAISEGEDLGDTFSACSNLLNYWVSSLASFASHIAHIGARLKAVRNKEEALDDMHRRRKSLTSKADSLDEELNKMGPEDSRLRLRTDLLTGLREQIHTLDLEIMNEKAKLGDFKRTKAREWMGILFGALLECSQKGTVVATFGRTITGYVPTDKTQPGPLRTHYTGHSEVELLVLEAELELHKISFMGQVGDKFQQPSNQYHIVDIPGLPRPPPSSPPPPMPIWPYPSFTLPEYKPHPQSRTDAPGPVPPRYYPLNQPPAPSPIKSSLPFPYPPQGSSGLIPGHQPHLSQSSTRSGSGFTPSYPQPAITPALHPTRSFNNASGSGLIPERKTTGDILSSSVAGVPGDGRGLDGNRNIDPPRLSADGPPPSEPVPAYIQDASNEGGDGIGLSYLNSSAGEGPSRRSEEKPLSDSDSGSRGDRKVRREGVRDVDTELEERYSEEIRKNHETRRSAFPTRDPYAPSPAYRRTPPSPTFEPDPEPIVPTPSKPTYSEMVLAEISRRQGLEAPSSTTNMGGRVKNLGPSGSGRPGSGF